MTDKEGIQPDFSARALLNDLSWNVGQLLPPVSVERIVIRDPRPIVHQHTIFYQNFNDLVV